MLYIPKSNQYDLNLYFNHISSKLQRALSRSKVNRKVKATLTVDRLKKIITDEPQKLVGHHTRLMKELVPGYTEKSYKDYVKCRSKRKKTDKEKKLVKKYSVVTELISIFNYDAFVSGAKETAYFLAQKLDRNTCTYCNRIYSITVVNRGSNGKIIKHGSVTRPQFDHWYAKAIYPCLSLSFYNLIPSCSICNASIKGDADFSLQTHTHPYEREIGQKFEFTYGFTSLNRLYVDLNVTGKKMSKTLEAFKIREVYDGHSELELKDLYDLRHAYTDNYLETINKTFRGFRINKNEAYRLVFGAEADEKNFHKRPFSKFKKDILKELGISI